MREIFPKNVFETSDICFMKQHISPQKKLKEKNFGLALLRKLTWKFQSEDFIQWEP